MTYTDDTTCACCDDPTYDPAYDPAAGAYDGSDEFADMTTMSVDTDLDGYAETTLVDLDADGLADATLYEDVVSGATVIAADLDGDGVMETMAVDYDGDGVIDYETTVSDPLADPTDPTDPLADPSDETDPTDLDDPVPFAVDDEPGDLPVDGGDDGIHGDPMAEIEYHQVQPGPVDCLPTSVAMTLSEITGEPVAAEEVVQVANDMGVMTATGMAPEDGVRLFEHFGVDAEATSGTVDDLRSALDEGREVIIGLDADDLYGMGDAPFASDIVSGHAVVITGIDDEAGLVYVNDPGFPDGAGVAIPIDMFEDAWEDADNTMIVTHEGDLGAAAGGAEAADADPSILDLILLPITFVVQR